MVQPVTDTVVYTESLDGISPASLRGFFVGWPFHPAPETHLRILEGSDHVILALDEESRQVVGFINALTDGVLVGYIPLLEVLPEYQGRGIGSELVRRMQARLGYLFGIDLLCDPEMQPLL